MDFGIIRKTDILSIIVTCCILQGSEKSVQAAKSNYEALNAQLLDELPKMYSLSFKLLKDCMKTFVQAQKKFYTSILHCMTETINVSEEN